MVLYGDSHALMWFDAMNDIAKAAHWKLVILGKGYCMWSKYPPDASAAGGPILSTCVEWQRFAVRHIRRIDPELVVLVEGTQQAPGGKAYTLAQWRQNARTALEQIERPNTHLVVLGDIPNIYPDDQSPPDCLARNSTDVQACSASRTSYLDPYNRVEAQTAAEVGGRYIDVTPWFCAKRCSVIIGQYQVYLDAIHINTAYSIFLEGVLSEQVNLAHL